MAKLRSKDYGEAGKNVLLAVGGGTLLNTFVVQRFDFLANLLGNLPADVGGVSVPLLATGYAALLLGMMFMK